MKISNTTKNTLIASKGSIADTFLTRMVGLLRHNSLAEEEALVITQCNSIHMFFMKFPIDAIFVDKNNKVVGLSVGIKPFRLSPIFFKSSFVIEVAVGTIDRTNTTVGDKIKIL